MKYFFSELQKRNKLLYWFGWLFIIGGVGSAIMIQFDDTVVLGINAWIKPMKFFLSVGIFSWTIGWYMHYLRFKRKTIIYSWMVVIIMTFEQSIVVWQAANGRLSHFNISTPLYGMLFMAMGIAIGIFTLWTIYLTWLFFRQKNYTVPMPYIWGIRSGLILFILFSLEGGMMSSQLSHTVGGADGGPGLPVLNWSKAYGDLRVAHFFGIHSLQVLPITGYFLARNTKQLFLFAGLYFIWVCVLFAQALYAIPVIN